MGEKTLTMASGSLMKLDPDINEASRLKIWFEENKKITPQTLACSAVGFLHQNFFCNMNANLQNYLSDF